MSKFVDFYLIGELVDSHGNVHYEDLKNLPTADVVEVVRCKDCVFDNGILEDCCHVYQEKRDCPMDFVQSDDDFCSWGVRRERK